MDYIPILFGNRLAGWIFSIFFLISIFFLFYATIKHFRKKNIIPLQMNQYTGECTVLGKRSSQQDRVYTAEKLENNNLIAFIAVCDGMGGMDNGDYASSYCINQLKLLFEMMPLRIKNINLLKDEILMYDYVLSQIKDEQNNLLKSGTTLVAAYVENNLLTYVSVGDSRLYLLQGNALIKLTTDHNYYLELLEMVDSGEISIDEAESHPQKEALINFVGMGNVNHFDFNNDNLSLNKNDIIVACSDGLTKAIIDEELKEILVNYRAELPTIIAQKLTDAALDKHYKNQDNTTVAIIKF